MQAENLITCGWTQAELREYEKSMIHNLITELSRQERLITVQIQALTLRYDAIVAAEDAERRVA